jgi:hypothetical protein
MWSMDLTLAGYDKEDEATRLLMCLLTSDLTRIDIVLVLALPDTRNNTWVESALFHICN